MESIGEFMQELAKRTPRQLLTPDQQLDKMFRSSGYLQAFQQAHPELGRDDYLKALSSVYTAVKEQYWCERCPGLEKCPNLVKGHRSKLEVTQGSIVSPITPCEKQQVYEEDQRRRRLMRSYYISEETMQASFEKLELDAENRAAVAAGILFSERAGTGEKLKGLYLHGPFGVGKSYLMGAIARELSERNVPSLMVYVPDFIREMKDSLADHSHSAKLEVLKEVPVLILDDIGAENLTPWVRDEIIGVILNHRVNNHLPTLFTSNYSLEELEEHMSISNGNRIERTKAARVMERIRHYVDVYPIMRKNQRIEGK
ncbi:MULTISPECIES: primosomal protein DnaI [Brevibacillus]|jgi:primosomal protein DnaI|uniref:Primosomal protein DnaI n=1 Tax=Brevibacillus borstelensis AK1 TaxID=1300222 RepID=M8DHS4_9BACL|nr:primosomal protein DnaI [Brevibacillus borstelensis]EMT53078.1 primosomal protein DnaI [Brevibacillus borstelensis AK1]KKX55531.1 prepilin peptidase [Brevibacillus borstelensis cifa_chp40]MBE5397502.1 primosomal protein DnaI [Brevibacillus borstelensis]MCC0566744.1 primosomal protein DnaI [Brevibacillus borstelensis]MCM3473226.1 primosomal protein DnaI [Brevibacillus borstelensis]